jgi:Transposase IS4
MSVYLLSHTRQELKSLADGESSILLNLEFMEGKDAQKLKEYCYIYPSSIALTLRIVKRYFGSGTTLHADSAFSSVATAKALRSRGVHFMGCVKTACKAFPKSFFQQWSNDDNVLRGSHKTLKSTITLEDTVENVFAVGWKDKTTKQIICTRGLTSVMGNPSVRHRRCLVETDWGHENDRYDLPIPRPQAIEMFFSCFSNIAVLDHYRQVSQALEKNWNTKTRWHRLFATLFCMVCTDAFLAYRLETRNRQMGGERFPALVGISTYPQRRCTETT